MNRNVQNTRFSYDENAVFSGRQIHRGRPIKFQLNGVEIKGYEGDTILSALMGSGYNSVGIIRDEPMALTSSFSPQIMLKHNTSLSFPMARTPAQNGMELTFYRSPDFEEINIAKPKFNFIDSILGRTKRSLDFDFEAELTLPNAWLEQKSEEQLRYDLVIIGGGVAGMGAAQKATEHGLHVALIEKDLILGGDAQFFGAYEGEQRPVEFVSQLVADISNSDQIDIFLNAEAISLGKNHTRVHSISVQKGILTSKIIDFQANNFILATGVLERLPIFAGNRLPGIIGAKEAFGLAEKFGIWQGNTSIISTNSSPATQVALLAADMGICIEKLADSRSAPKSRFFEFAKAYGISLATGTQVHSVSLDKDHQLQVQFCLASNTQKFTGDPIPVDRLIVCGGWQPDLRLWHGVGGKTKWNITTEKLQAIGEVSRVILAGSCLGLQAMTDCWNSGQNAINSMLQKDKNVVFVPTINPEYESADGQLPISNSSANSTNCYLDSGHSLTQPSLKPQTGFWKKLFSTRQKTQEDFSQTKGENTLVDVAAKVELGELPAQFAGSFAQERCGVVADLQHSTPNVDIYSTLTNDDKGKAPSYLSGRFGRKEHIVRLKLSGNFGVEVGNFVFRDHGESSPLAAIGSIFEIDKNDRSTALALLDTSISGNQTALIVRHGTAATHARIETPES